MYRSIMKVFCMVKRISLFFLALAVAVSCGSDDEPEAIPTPPEPEALKITIDPSLTYQEMVGFGGALTWYSERILKSAKKSEITDLIFEDLGADIIRFKNCYYPDNYPTVKSTTSMSDDNSKVLWDATNQLHQLAKAQNPNVKILLSSWGPPAALKSNNSTRQGTLKKDGSVFMYDAYATYWEDLLNNLPFDPEYISIQNEPSYINAGWTTCEWSSTETSTLPGYNTAFDKVYEKIQGRPDRPVMIGPESPNTTSYSNFVEALKNKSHIELFAYHPYDINASTPASQIKAALQGISNYNSKPNIMTEYADNLSWFNTAVFIHNTLVYANSSGYIYWKLVWSQPGSGAEDAAMVSVDDSGNYQITPFYYVMKHYAKHVDSGYKRIDVVSGKENLSTSAFINPSKNEVTVVIINTGTSGEDVEFNVTGKTITSITADQTKEGDFFKSLEQPGVDGIISIPAKSVTTVVISI
ncbi:MAG TPA: glycoside hydrolase family 30 beta sandwich domain-containing protein [Chryseolinea sp.]